MPQAKVPKNHITDPRTRGQKSSIIGGILVKAYAYFLIIQNLIYRRPQPVLFIHGAKQTIVGIMICVLCEITVRTR
jgi:hypothetical protein